MTNFYLSMAPHLIFLPSTQNFFNSHDTTRLHSRASSKVQNNRKILHPRPVNFKLVGKPENHKWLGSDLLKKMSHNGSKTSLKSHIFFLKVSFIVQLCKRLKWSAHEMVSRLVFSLKESWIHKICLALIKINGYFDIFLFILILNQKLFSENWLQGSWDFFCFSSYKQIWSDFAKLFNAKVIIESNLPYTHHYNPQFLYFLPHFWKPKTFFKELFFIKFWP